MTSYENALEQALQITYVTRSHELRLNSQPADCANCATGKSSQLGVFQVFAKLKSISIKLGGVCTDEL